MQLSFFRKCSLFEKDTNFTYFTCRCASQGRSQEGQLPPQNFTLRQSPLMSCLTSGWSPQDVAYHKPDTLSQLETLYFCVLELGETAVMWYMQNSNQSIFAPAAEKYYGSC